MNINKSFNNNDDEIINSKHHKFNVSTLEILKDNKNKSLEKINNYNIDKYDISKKIYEKAMMEHPENKRKKRIENLKLKKNLSLKISNPIKKLDCNILRKNKQKLYQNEAKNDFFISHSDYNNITINADFNWKKSVKKNINYDTFKTDLPDKSNKYLNHEEVKNYRNHFSFEKINRNPDLLRKEILNNLLYMQPRINKTNHLKKKSGVHSNLNNTISINNNEDEIHNLKKSEGNNNSENNDIPDRNKDKFSYSQEKNTIISDNDENYDYSKEQITISVDKTNNDRLKEFFNETETNYFDINTNINHLNQKNFCSTGCNFNEKLLKETINENKKSNFEAPIYAGINVTKIKFENNDCNSLNISNKNFGNFDNTNYIFKNTGKLPNFNLKKIIEEENNNKTNKNFGKKYFIKNKNKIFSKNKGKEFEINNNISKEKDIDNNIINENQNKYLNKYIVSNTYFKNFKMEPIDVSLSNLSTLYIKENNLKLTARGPSNEFTFMKKPIKKKIFNPNGKLIDFIYTFPVQENNDVAKATSKNAKIKSSNINVINKNIQHLNKNNQFEVDKPNSYEDSSNHEPTSIYSKIGFLSNSSKLPKEIALINNNNSKNTTLIENNCNNHNINIDLIYSNHKFYNLNSSNNKTNNNFNVVNRSNNIKNSDYIRNHIDIGKSRNISNNFDDDEDFEKEPNINSNNSFNDVKYKFQKNDKINSGKNCEKIKNKIDFTNNNTNTLINIDDNYKYNDTNDRNIFNSTSYKNSFNEENINNNENNLYDSNKNNNNLKKDKNIVLGKLVIKNSKMNNSRSIINQTNSIFIDKNLDNFNSNLIGLKENINFNITKGENEKVKMNNFSSYSLNYNNNYHNKKEKLNKNSKIIFKSSGTSVENSYIKKDSMIQKEDNIKNYDDANIEKKKMYLIGELDKVTQSTRYNDYSKKQNLNRNIYDKIFSGILDIQNLDKNKEKNGIHNKNRKKEIPFLDYLAIDKFNVIYSNSYKKTIGFLNDNNFDSIRSKNLKNNPNLNQNAGSMKNSLGGNLLEKIKNSSCYDDNVFSNKIFENTKFSNFFSSTNFGNFKDSIKFRSTSTSRFLMEEKAKKIYQPRKTLMIINSNKF